MRPRLLTTIASLVVIAGCGGGGEDVGGGGGGGVSPRYAISGILTPGADSAIDSDTNDPTVAPVPNNNILNAQVVRNPVTVGGYASGADVVDVYRVDLAGDQIINLFVAEDGSTNDLDLVLADAGGTVVAESLGTDKLETIVVPGSGSASYLVAVEVFEGASNYVLSITQQGQTAAVRATHGMRTQADFVPGQAMVSYRDPAGAVAMKSMGATLSSVPGRFDVIDLSAVIVPAKAGDASARGGLRYADAALAEKASTLRAIKSLRQRPEVSLAEPDLIRHASLLPNDEFEPQQWHYDLINLPQAWDITQGSANVIVAVADTGVRLDHRDLAGKFDANDPNGFDFVATSRSVDGNGPDGDADDPGDGGVAGQSSFHGTHVAGTIAATTNNGVGVAGVGWNTSIMPLRVLGKGGAGSSSEITSAILYAAHLPNSTGQFPPVKASIINLSLGSDQRSAIEERAYADVVAAGVIVIAAAGNKGDSRLSYPASYPGVISVAAVGRQKQRAPYSQFNGAIDVAAPGGDQSRAAADGILSTLSSDSNGPIQDGLGYLQGTSMASPHVAGVVALMKAVNPNLTPAQFAALLQSGAITEDLGAAGFDNAFGHGLIDANKAVREAVRLAGGGALPDNASLTVQPQSLSFGNSSSSAALDALNAGTGSLTVISVSDDAPWLSVSPLSGLGRYTATVNRTGLADGNYFATITFVSSVNTVTVPVLMTVGPVSSVVDAGKQYIVATDPDSLDVVDGDDLLISGGRYTYRMTVPDGDYLLFAGTDSDDDGFICDDGEACGSFPLLDSPTPVTIRGGPRSGIDFLVSFDLSVPATQGERPPREGFRVRR